MHDNLYPFPCLHASSDVVPPSANLSPLPHHLLIFIVPPTYILGLPRPSVETSIRSCSSALNVVEATDRNV